MYHYVLGGLTILILIGSFVNLYESLGNQDRLYSASLITAISIALVLLFVFARSFPLKAQDRAIRAEENLRHFAMTGKLLDSRLTLAQIIGLRFASDGEFVALAAKAAAEGMSRADIKKAVKNWRPDYERL
jgi:putative flippase GtrA